MSNAAVKEKIILKCVRAAEAAPGDLLDVLIARTGADFQVCQEDAHPLRVTSWDTQKREITVGS